MNGSSSVQTPSRSTCAPSFDAAAADISATGYTGSSIANRPSSAPPKPTIAEAGAGETRPGGSARIGGGFPVAWIEPVDGWTLRSFTYWDGDGFLSPAWFARGPDRDELLPVSRFLFEPTQDRFAWLVRNDFPRCPGVGPWTGAEIDERVAGEVL